MAIKFKGTDIPGEHGAIVRGSPEFHARRMTVHNLRGEGEIVGKTGGRTIVIPWLIFHNKFTGTTPDKLLQELDKLSEMIGDNGSLEETGAIKQKLKYCTFESWELVQWPGREDASPLLDVGRTLRTANDQIDGGWFQLITLRFRQLKTN